MKKINILVLLVAGAAMMNVQAPIPTTAAATAAAKAAGTTAAKPGTTATATATAAAPAKGNWNPVQGIANFFGNMLHRNPAAATAPTK